MLMFHLLIHLEILKQQLQVVLDIIVLKRLEPDKITLSQYVREGNQFNPKVIFVTEGLSSLNFVAQ